MGASRTARRQVEKAKAPPSSALPGVGMALDADLIDALVGIGLQTQQGALLFNGWKIANKLPLDVIYTLKVGPGEITDARKAPKPKG